MKIIYLHPRSSFVSKYDSDFIFGLFLSILYYFNGKKYTDELIKEFENDEPPFLVSNAFFFTLGTDGKKNLYFPKPMSSSRLQNVDDIQKYSSIKDFKKLKYLEFNYFAEFISGNITDNTLFQNFINNKEKLQIPKFFDVVSNPHVQINRLTNTSKENNFYHTDENFIKNGGMFFLFDGKFEIIEPILRFLHHYGIGGDASLGKGSFRIEYEDFEFPKIEQPNCFVNLSTYYPKQSEIEAFKQKPQLFFYEIEQKTGMMSSAIFGGKKFKKMKVNYLSPGSIFPLINDNKYYGRLVDVQQANDLKIKFNGFAFALPAKIKEELL